jgi:hypothetical protein
MLSVVVTLVIAIAAGTRMFIKVPTSAELKKIGSDGPS